MPGRAWPSISAWSLRGRVLWSHVGLNTRLVRAGSGPLWSHGLLLTLLLGLLPSLALRRDSGLGTVRLQTVQKVLYVPSNTLRIAAGVR